MILKLKKTFSFASGMLALGIFFAMVSYRAITERYNDPLDYCLLWFVCLAAGICTTPRSKHQVSSALGILIIPFAIDNLLTCYDEMFFLGAAVLCASALVCYTVAVILACYGDIRAGRYRKKWARFFQSYLYRSRRIISFIFAVVFAACSIWSLVEKKKEEADQVLFSISQAESTLQTMENNIDLLRRLEQDRWDTLSDEEKHETLQEVADMECRYLGLPQVTVSVVEMEDSSVGGYYSHSAGAVCINQDAVHVGTAEHLLSIVFHEIYHSMEHGIVEVYLSADPKHRELQFFDKAEIYMEELNNYISGSENFEKYYEQLVERDSREYAQKRTGQYREVIEYIKNTPRQATP